MKSFEKGARLGEFEILGPLGEGGMGRVLHARDTQLGREVAIKVIDSEILENEQARARFSLEARSLAAIQHRNVATIYRFEESGDVPFLAMEMLRGQTLGDRLKQGSLVASEIASVALDLARGMEAAHARGVLHRDLKPANVFLETDGTAKILDFGLAKTHRSTELTLAPTLTVTGQVLGTYPYMSPEQLRGEELDGGGDLWAFGCLLYEMVVGTRAFDAQSGPALAAQILEGEPKWDSLGSTASGPLFRLVKRCLARDPENRPESFTEVRKELELMREAGFYRKVVKRPSRFGPVSERAVFLGALLLVVVASLFYLAYRNNQAPVLGDGGEQGEAPARRLAVVPFVELGSVPESLRGVIGRQLAEGSAAGLRATQSLDLIGMATTSLNLGRGFGRSGNGGGVWGGLLLLGEVSGLSGAENDLRVDVRLFDAVEARSIWQEAFEGRALDPANLSALIGRAVAGALGLADELGGLSSIADVGTSSAEAYRSFVRGRELCRALDPRDRARGLAILRSAAGADVSWPAPLAETVRCLFYPYLLGLVADLPDLQTLEATLRDLERVEERSSNTLIARSVIELLRNRPTTALTTLERAQALFGDSPETRFHRGLIRQEGAPEVEKRWDEGQADMAAALAEDRSDVRQVALLALARAATHDFALAEQDLRRALELEPQDPVLEHTLAKVLLLAGKVEDSSTLLDRHDPVAAMLQRALFANDLGAVSQLRRRFANHPAGVPVALPLGVRPRPASRGMLLGLLCEVAGEECAQAHWREAAVELERLVQEEQPDLRNSPFLLASLALAQAAAGEATQANQTVTELNGLIVNALPVSVLADSIVDLAAIQARLGEEKGAVDVLKQAFTVPAWTSTELLAVDPRFGGIRESEEMVAFLAQWKGVRVARSVLSP